jgi:carbonic anhydrase/acetyltransferase-like protein (isoleucine patch superfamily)
MALSVSSKPSSYSPPREHHSTEPIESPSFRESVTLMLLSWIPRRSGERLRRIFYRSLLGPSSHSFRIFRDVELMGARSISLGQAAVIRCQVSIEATSPGSQVLLGDRAVLDRGVDIRVVPGFSGCQITIGADTYIGPYCCLAGPGNITIGKHCLIASHTSMYANNHIFADAQDLIVRQGITRRGIIIGDDCWLGSGVRVVDGVTIGRG